MEYQIYVLDMGDGWPICFCFTFNDNKKYNTVQSFISLIE